MSHSPKQNIKYQKVYPSDDDLTVEEKDLELNTNYNSNSNTKLTEIKSCNDLCKWMTDKPLTKLPFFYFFISLLIPPIIAIIYILDNNSAYILSGIFGLFTCIYALNHFRLLLHLKKQIAYAAEMNIKFKKQKKEVSKEVNRVTSAQNELFDTQNKLQNLIEEKRVNVKKFTEIQRNMHSINVNNIDGIDGIRQKANKLIDNCTTSLHKKERKVLFGVFERFAKKGNRHIMTRDKFDEFLEMIPRTYADRFNRLGTFKKLSGDKTYIDLKDFEVCLDLFHEMSVKDIDMDFKIELTQSDSVAINENNLNVNDLEKQFKRQISITKRSMPGQQLSLEDIELDNSIVIVSDD